jgi:transcriptional regulator NrdR family protein
MKDVGLCPFCKSNKIKVNMKRPVDGEYGNGELARRVTASARCGSCHSRGPTVTAERIPSSNSYGLDVFSQNYHWERKAKIEAEYEALRVRAIEAWNKRAE